MRDDEKHLGKPLRLSEAIERLGFDPDVRKFRRRLLAAERLTGRTILTRIGSAKRVTYLVTMRALRRYFPEWFTDEIERAAMRRRDAAADRLSKEIRSLEETISEHADGWTKLAEKTRGIDERLRRLEARWAVAGIPGKANQIRPQKAASEGPSR